MTKNMNNDNHTNDHENACSCCVRSFFLRVRDQVIASSPTTLMTTQCKSEPTMQLSNCDARLQYLGMHGKSIEELPRSSRPRQKLNKSREVAIPRCSNSDPDKQSTGSPKTMGYHAEQPMTDKNNPESDRTIESQKRLHAQTACQQVLVVHCSAFAMLFEQGW